MNQWWLRCILGVLIGLAVAGVVLVVRQPPEARRSADFTVFYSAGLLVREGHPEAVYDRARLGETMRQVSQGGIDSRLQFVEPLALTFCFIPLTLLPAEVAFRIWQLVTLVLMGASLVILAGAVPIKGRVTAVAPLLLLAAAPTWAVLTEGQYVALPLLGASLLVRAAAQGSAALAGPGATLLALKPQYLPAYLVMLWVFRKRRALVAGLGGALLVGLSPLLAGGFQGLWAMMHSALTINDLTPLRLSESWAGVVGALLPASPATVVADALFAVSVLGLAVLALRRRPALVPFAAGVGLVALLASPHALPHDLVLLAVPAWLAFALEQRGLLPSPMPGLALVQLALLMDLHGTPVTLAPLVMTGLLVAYGLAFRRRAYARRQAQHWRAA